MRRQSWAIFTIFALACSAGDAFGQGFVLPGVGPVNRSMGGAATAAPLDSIGALVWNPATLTGLEQSRVDIGVDLVYNRNTVDSGLFLGTPGEFRGTSDSNVGVWALPAIGVVYKPQQSIWTYGIGLNAIGGFSSNWAGSTTNPIFTPPPPGGTGFGPAYSRLGILQISPTAAVEIAEGLSFGISPLINIADAQASPFPFDTPNPPGVYASGTGNRNVWGLGVQAGLFYEAQSGINLGASIKSPQWFERLEVNSHNGAGLGRELSTQFEYPLIASLGASYTGLENVVLAADVRYVDFANTQLFGESPTLTPSGALRGLGWQSVWIVALGGQLQLTDRLSVRTGYSYNQNPIPDSRVMYSILAPAPYQHVLNLGASLQMTDAIIAHLTWVHGFDTTVTGPYLSPAGPIPLSKVSVSQEIDTLVMGLSVLF